MYLRLMTALLLFCTSLSRAQIVSGYGIKFGLVSSELKTKGGIIIYPGGFLLREDLNQRLGPQIGLFVNFFKIPHLDLQVEVSYLEKGAEEEFMITTPDQPEGTGESYTVDSYHFDYLALSLLAQPKLNLGAANPYGTVGPSLNLLIANRNGLFTGTKDLTPSLVIGVGVELLKPFAFPVLLEVRYNPDLDYFFENEFRKSEFRLWQVLVGVNLH